MKKSTQYRNAILSIIILQFSVMLCNAQLNLNVTVNATPSCTHNGTAAAVVSNGTPPYTYTWYLNTGVQLYTQTISGLSGGWFFVMVTDAFGNDGYASAVVPYPFTIGKTVTPDSCNIGLGTCNLTVTGGVSPYTYLWDNGATTATATGLHTGYVDCTITDANGCYMLLSDNDSLLAGTYIPGISPITINFTTTNANCLNGTATANAANGVAPYTYSWNTTPVQTTQTATALHAGAVYLVTVTDNTGCEGGGYVYINTSSNLSVNINKVPENCQYGNGSATAVASNGVAPFSYLWNTGATTAVASGLSQGNYEVTITDANGCSVLGYGYVNRTSPIQLSVVPVPTSCTVNNGSIAVSVTGGTPAYNYYWQTMPIQTTATATGLGIGNYTVIVSDANLCSTSNSLILNDNSSLSLNVSATGDTCNQAIGTGIAVATAGNPPYSYQWTTAPLQSTATATGLSYGWHSVTLTDNAGCVRKGKSWVVNYSPVSIYGGAVNASCIYVADGSIAPAVLGGTPPYTYQWSNGATTASVSGLLTGWYDLDVTDAGGCQASVDYFVDYNSVLPCAVVISGRVYNDINGDCLQGAAEYGIANTAVHCTPGGGTHFTDAAGDYSFTLPTGTYTVDHNVPQYFSLGCPAGGSYTLALPVMGNTAPNTDFADPGFVNDLSLNCYNLNLPVQGFNYSQSLCYVNKGSVNTSGTLTVNHDPQIPFSYSNPMPSNYNAAAHTATWNLTNLYPNLYSDIYINYNIPSSVLLGTQIHFHDSIAPFAGDTFVYDNYLWYLESVVGPYDPNYIEVRPSGTGPQGYIAANDSAMEYIVHFQNTGTYLAQRVVIKIQLDSHLDPLTVQPGAASHNNYTAIITPSNELIFTFENINLPDSTFNEPGSHGFVSYTVKQVSNLQAGTTITGQANIFFDFSTPVATNIALNTILTGIHEVDNPFSLQIAPNPFNDEFELHYRLENVSNVSVRIYDITGKSIYESAPEKQLSGEHTMKWNNKTASLSQGLYFLNFTAGEKNITLKMIKL